MTSGPAFPCPKCKRVLDANSWHGANGGACWHCRTEFEFISFPARTAARVRAAPQLAELSADSVCFFHAENRAEVVCEECGRLLCPVCAVTFAGRRICPTCVAASKNSGAEQVVRQRVLYDGIALTLAGGPLLIWPVTLITAPVAFRFRHPWLEKTLEASCVVATACGW